MSFVSIKVRICRVFCFFLVEIHDDKRYVISVLELFLTVEGGGGAGVGNCCERAPFSACLREEGGGDAVGNCRGRRSAFTFAL